MSNDEEYMKVVFFFTQLQEAAFVINDKLSFDDRYVQYIQHTKYNNKNKHPLKKKNFLNLQFMILSLLIHVITF